MTQKPYRERRYTAQDGLKLYFRDYGPLDGGKTTVLCLAGLTRNSRDFSAVAKTLMTDRRVICPDYRGRGRSDFDPHWHNYHPPTYINDVRHLLAALNIHRVVVVGTSMGGLLVMGMGAAMPTVLAGAVINDVGPEIEQSGIAKILDYMQRGAAGFQSWPDAVAFLRGCFPNLPAETDDQWLAITQGTFKEAADGRIVHDWDVNILKPLQQNTEQPDLWPMFGTLGRVPAAVVRGDRSDVLSAETLARMHDMMPGLKSATIPDVGHAPTLSEPPCQEILRHVLDAADSAHH